MQHSETISTVDVSGNAHQQAGYLPCMVPEMKLAPRLLLVFAQNWIKVTLMGVGFLRRHILAKIKASLSQVFWQREWESRLQTETENMFWEVGVSSREGERVLNCKETSACGTRWPGKAMPYEDVLARAIAFGLRCLLSSRWKLMVTPGWCEATCFFLMWLLVCDVSQASFYTGVDLIYEQERSC